MKKPILAALAALALATPVWAQGTTGQNSGRSDTIIRTPPSNANASGSGVSGNVGSPGRTYPGRLRNYNSPSTNFSIPNGVQRLPRR
jgi:hypothetical protein